MYQFKLQCLMPIFEALQISCDKIPNRYIRPLYFEHDNNELINYYRGIGMSDDEINDSLKYSHYAPYGTCILVKFKEIFYILTAHHCFDKAKKSNIDLNKIFIRTKPTDRDCLPLEGIHTFGHYDLAALRVTRELDEEEKSFFYDLSKNIENTTPYIAIGFPDEKTSRCIERSNFPTFPVVKFYTTNMKLTTGFSGGGLFNNCNELIGMIDTQTTNISIQDIKAFFDNISQVPKRKQITMTIQS